VDGGILSNFPVWLFDVADRDPVRPTFGFRLIGGRGVGCSLAGIVNALGWPVQLGTEIFHTATDAWDERFMSHSTRVRTCPVDADDVGTTDFDIGPDKQNLLIDNGRRAAASFLDAFDTAAYINTYGRKLT
jgi:NTE family protein